MKKILLYTYLGTNGTITSPVHLEGIYCVKKYQLTADDEKFLTKNGNDLVKSIVVNENDLDLWYEIPN